MWDTTKDYRILVASKARENYLNLIPTASFRGSWNKKQAIDLGKQMNSDFQSLTYSYLEGDELANSPDVASLKEKALKIDIKVGEVMSVTQHPKNDNLMLCNVNLGKRAITVVTNDLNVKDDNKVGVSLLPPQAFSDIVSEGMFLGMNGSILKDVEGELGAMPKGIPMESLNETRNLVENYLK